MESKHCTVDFSKAPLGPEMDRIKKYVYGLPLPTGFDVRGIAQKAVAEYIVSRSKEALAVAHQKALCLFLLGKHDIYDVGDMAWLREWFAEAAEAASVTGAAFISPFNGVPGVAEFVRSMFQKYKNHRLSLAKRTSPKLHPFLTLDELQLNIRDFGTPYPVRDDPDKEHGSNMASGFVAWLTHGDTTYIPYSEQLEKDKDADEYELADADTVYGF